MRLKVLHYTAVFSVFLWIASCGESKSENSIKETTKFNVEYHGALKDMMHKGDLTAKAVLKDYENLEHFYALGAIANLKGEIQIFDSKVYNSSVMDSSLTFDNSYNAKATLLVYATVSNWESFQIPDSVVSYEQLEVYIEQTAKLNRIKTDEPFPFLIEGTATSMDWHVINWKDGDTEHSHEKHINSGLNGTLQNTEVELLGFYSDSHHAIFTHHTTNMHIHLKTDDNKVAGHLDGLTLGEGMILKLPYTN